MQETDVKLQEKQKPTRILDFVRPREHCHCKSTTLPNSDYVLMRQIFSASMMGEIVGQASILTSDDASTLTKQKQLDSRLAQWVVLPRLYVISE